MSIGYRELSEAELVWRENRENINLQGRQLLRRVLNSALVELDEQFRDALNRGEILEITPTKIELQQLLLASAERELGTIEQNV
jgi:hypothetical protein